MSSATLACLRTSLRGAPIGFAGLALIALPLAGLGWHVAWRAAVHGRAPGVVVALAAPLFAGALALMAMTLLSSMWVLMRKPTFGRLAPGAQPAMRRAMVVSGLGLWLMVGLPALALLLAEVRLGSGQLTLAAALAWGLGVPLAGAALPAAFALLLARAPALIGWAAVVALGLMVGAAKTPRMWIEMAPDARNTALLGLGLAGLVFAAWIFKRVALARVATAAPSAQGCVRRRWQATPVRERCAGPLPRDARWLVAPNRLPLRLRDAALMLLAALALLVVFPRATGLPMPYGFALVTVAYGLSHEWMFEPWVSPRWALLPGGPPRRNTAWWVWAGKLQSAMPRVAAVPLAFALVAMGDWGMPVSQAVGSFLVCAGFVMLSAGVAVATVPVSRSPQVQVLGPVLCTAVVGGTYGAAEQRLWDIAHGDALILLLLTAGVALALAATGVLVVAASRRAWARYDWSRMSAQPAVRVG